MASDHDELNNIIRIVESCLLAGKPDRIVPRLRQGHRAEAVEAELAQEALAETARPPERTAAARVPTSAASTNDALRDAIEKRFRAQNRRPG